MALNVENCKRSKHTQERRPRSGHWPENLPAKRRTPKGRYWLRLWLRLGLRLRLRLRLDSKSSSDFDCDFNSVSSWQCQERHPPARCCFTRGTESSTAARFICQPQTAPAEAPSVRLPQKLNTNYMPGTQTYTHSYTRTHYHAYIRNANCVELKEVSANLPTLKSTRRLAAYGCHIRLMPRFELCPSCRATSSQSTATERVNSTCFSPKTI